LFNNLLKMKKGQVHVTETILVVFIVLIILIIGVVGYYRFSFEKNKSLEGELSERAATIMLAKAVNLDELACGDGDCVDAGKFLPFRRVLGEDLGRFRSIFGRKKIVFRQIYPVLDGSVLEVECDTANYIQMDYPNNCGKWTVYEFNPDNEYGSKISTIVSLYYPEFDRYVVGRLEIDHYDTIRK